MRHRRTPAVVAAVAALALGGCTTHGDGPAPDDADKQQSSPTTPAQNEVATATPRARPEPGPLEAYLGLFDVVHSAQEMVADYARRENLISACMAEQGFEYTPTVPAVDDVQYVDEPLPGTREYAEDFGYGIWHPGQGEGYMWRRATNPNWDRMAAMSEAEAEAYSVALWGEVVDVGTDGTIAQEGGCSMVADEPQGADAAWLLGVRDEALAYLHTLDEDTRFAEVDAAWASCMANAGFTERSPAAVEQRLRDDQQALVAGGTWPENDVVSQRADDEHRIALADMDCREATDWTAQHAAIELTLQQEYVDAHLPDLEALAAALAEQGS